MSAFKSNYSRIVVRQSELELFEGTTTTQSFRIAVHYTFKVHDPERLIAGLLIETSIEELIELLETLGVDYVESSSDPLSLAGRMITERGHFDAAKARDLLEGDPGPLTCYISNVTERELLDRLQNRVKR